MNLPSFLRDLFPQTAIVGGEKAPHDNTAVVSGADAQFGLGRRHDEAEAPDFQKAVECYRNAAELGHSAAQLNLGLMYANGRGVPRDEAEAVNWIRKAAEGGNAAAQHNLGARCHRASLRMRSVDSSEDRIEAFKWLCLASAQGFHGSAAACERVTISMTSDEVVQGNQRANSFLARNGGAGDNGTDAASE